MESRELSSAASRLEAPPWGGVWGGYLALGASGSGLEAPPWGGCGVGGVSFSSSRVGVGDHAR